MRRLLLIAGLFFLLSGCQSGSVGNAALQTLRTAIWGTEPPSGAGLDQRYSYIRVTVGKTVAFLALGYVDPHPMGPIEVWYSADREVVRLQNGRLVGATGTLTEWRQVRVPGWPEWRELSARTDPFVWTRIRDVMPGYRFNTSDTLQLRVIPAPAQNAYLGRLPESLIWFEERLLSSSANPVDIPRPAIYAVELAAGSDRVVYAEQCLSPDLCLTWQRWTPGQ